MRIFDIHEEFRITPFHAPMDWCVLDILVPQCLKRGMSAYLFYGISRRERLDDTTRALRSILCSGASLQFFRAPNWVFPSISPSINLLLGLLTGILLSGVISTAILNQRHSLILSTRPAHFGRPLLFITSAMFGWLQCCYCHVSFIPPRGNILHTFINCFKNFSFKN